MTLDLKRLRGHHHALLAHADILRALFADKHVIVELQYFRPVADQLKSLGDEFPEVVEAFDLESHFADTFNGRKNYNVPSLQAAVSTALGKVKAELDQTEDGPVTQTRAFRYVADVSVRDILVHDYGEIQRAFVGRCWKAVTIMAGGAIEAILLDALLQDEPGAQEAESAPKERDIRRWGLADLINVAVEIGVVSGAAEKLSHSVRQYRNLIHPGVQLRSGLTVDAEEARIAIEVLHIVDRDLSG